MVISDRHKFVYYAIPRTATKAITVWLCKYYSGEWIYLHHTWRSDLDSRVLDPSYFRWCVVRNPYTRAVSLWRRSVGGRSFGDYPSFREWLRRLKHSMHRFKLRGMPLNSQSDFIDNADAAAGRQMDLVLRFESLDVGRLPFVGASHPPIEQPPRSLREYPKQLRETAKSWISFEDEDDKRRETMNVVFKRSVLKLFLAVFGKDLDRFGYSREVPAELRS